MLFKSWFHLSWKRAMNYFLTNPFHGINSTDSLGGSIHKKINVEMKILQRLKATLFTRLSYMNASTPDTMKIQEQS